MHFKKEINYYDYTIIVILFTHRNVQLLCAFTIFQHK